MGGREGVYRPCCVRVYKTFEQISCACGGYNVRVCIFHTAQEEVFMEQRKRRIESMYTCFIYCMP